VGNHKNKATPNRTLTSLSIMVGTLVMLTGCDLVEITDTKDTILVIMGSTLAFVMLVVILNRRSRSGRGLGRHTDNDNAGGGFAVEAPVGNKSSKHHNPSDSRDDSGGDDGD
jgi:hypothetical protein